MKVFNRLTAPDGRPLQNQTARITLRAPGNPFTTLTSEVIQAHAEDTNTTGIWIADLIPNAEYEQAGTWYHVDERDGLRIPDAQWDFRVPSVPNPVAIPGVPAGTYWIRDLLIVAPNPGGDFPPVPAHALGDHTDVDTTGETAGNVLRFDGTTWRPANVSGGTGSGYEQFQPTLVNQVTVTHNLGYRPSLSIFNDDWTERFHIFGVQHVDVNNAVISTDLPFRGWIAAS